MTNTFYQTLISKNRKFPFWMWWVGVWLTALVDLLSNLIRVCTFGILMPSWGFNVLAWAIKMQLEYRINHSDKDN